MRTRSALAALLAPLLAVAAPVPKTPPKPDPATAEQRKEVRENLKQIVIAVHTYHDANNRWPCDTPALSWRVLLLPYLEEGELYKQFDQAEAWDGPKNKKLIDKLPKVFAPTRVTAEKGETFYRGFAGDGAFGGGPKMGIFGITDGTSNTVAVIDAGEPVAWTKPGTDLVIDRKEEFPKMGGMIDGDFSCVMCDGSPRTLKREFDAKELEKFVTRAGGEIADEKKVFVK